MFRKTLSVLFVPVFFFLASSFASGASLKISDSGNGVYTVQGSGMDGVAAMEFTVTYDKASLSSPTVSQGSLITGALMVANTNNPGSIIIAIANTKAFSGSGPVVLISFANKGTGNVQLSIKKIIDDKGATVSATNSSGSISTPGIPFSQPSTSAGTTTDPSGTTASAAAPSSTSTTTDTTPSDTSAAAAAASPPTSMGTVTMPGDSQPKDDAKPAETAVTEPPQQTPPVAESVDAATAAVPPAVEKPVEPAASAEVNQTVYGSVLDRFRTYQGAKTPATMTALFTKAVAPAIRQEPAIAISDGKTNVRIIADLPAFAGSSPNFALSGARQVSLKKGDVSGRWILEALPNKNSMNATVTILNGSSVIEYPLATVSSVVKVSADESSFAEFLKVAGTKAPKRDLNADGRHDYLDDYIYTALYLIQKGAGKTQKK